RPGGTTSAVDQSTRCGPAAPGDSFFADERRIMSTTVAPTDAYPTRVSTEDPIAREHPTVWGSASDGPFDAEALTAHSERGFTILEDFLSPTEVDGFSAELAGSPRTPRCATTSVWSPRRRLVRCARSSRCRPSARRSTHSAGTRGC